MGGNNQVSLAAVVQDSCQICGKDGQPTAICFVNALYAGNRIALPADKEKAIENRSALTEKTDQ